MTSIRMNNNKTFLLSLLFGLTLFFPYQVEAHGIHVQVSQVQPDVIIKAMYHGSKICTNAKVTITFQQDGKESVFTEGNTDKEGIFSFKPDHTGTWTIIVDDEMGHRKKIATEIPTTFFPPAPTTAVQTPEKMAQVTPPSPRMEEQTTTRVQFTERSSWPYIVKIFLGVVLILALSFLFSRWQKKQESRSSRLS